MQSFKAVKKESKVKSLLCYACLTSDRTLFVLNNSSDEYKRIWTTIVDDVSLDVPLCWECLALLRNVKKFQEKVKSSQTILEQTSNEICIPKSLSNLSTAQPFITDSKTWGFANLTVTSGENEEYKIEFMTEAIKPEIEIKKENDEIFDHFNITDDFIEEIKEDAPPEIYFKQDLENRVQTTKYSIKNEPLQEGGQCNYEEPIENRNYLGLEVNNKSENVGRNSKQETEKSKHYKLELVKVDKGDTYTKLPISPLEVYDWMERERNCDYFKSLQRKCVSCAVRIFKGDSTSHVKAWHSKNNFSCDMCKCTFLLKSQLVNHINTHNYIHSCNECGFKCVHKSHMSLHVKKEHTRVVKCLECDMNFRTLRDFHNHYKGNHGEFGKTFICDYCKKRYNQKQVIENHIVRNHLRQYCADCKLTFRHWKSLKAHRKLKHHIERTEDTYCVQCDKQFDNIWQFRKHFQSYKVHTSERPPKKAESYACPVCGNVYAKRLYMKNHYDKVHADVPRFQCADCGKSCLTNAQLKRHTMYVHQNFERKRDKICTYCGRGFPDTAVLKNHIRTHTGERPFKCPHCESSFGKKTVMLKHIQNKHTNKEQTLKHR